MKNLYLNAILRFGHGHQTRNKGVSGGAKVLGKLTVPGRPTSLDDRRARPYCACSK